MCQIGVFELEYFHYGIIPMNHDKLIHTKKDVFKNISSTLLKAGLQGILVQIMCNTLIPI